MKTLIGKCDVFVGSRMHACIGAVSQCVPTVSLAYSDKFKGVMAPLGESSVVVDLREATFEDTENAINGLFDNRIKKESMMKNKIDTLLVRLSGIIY